MPKISELPAATTLSGSEQVSGVQGGTTKRFTLSQASTFTGTGFYNVKSYGALGDGTTNDTVAIQATIDAAGSAGGGVVFFPPGTFIVQPASISTVYCLLVNRKNIHFMGASRYVSKIKSLLYNGHLPLADVPPPTVGGLVQRGYMFHMVDSIERITVRFSGLELNGSAGKTATPGNPPANPTTGTGWDITHMGIHADACDCDEWIVEDCYLHGFLGEFIYNGGQALEKLIIRNCKLDDGNGNLISTSAQNCDIHSNELSNAYQGMENSYWNGINVYRDNYLHDIDHGGFHVYPSTSSSDAKGYADIYNNRLERVIIPLLSPGGRNMRIFGNMFIDCTGVNIALQTPGSGGSGTDNISMFNVQVFNNTIITTAAVTSESVIPIVLSTNDLSYHANNLIIRDNWASQTRAARDAPRLLGPMLQFTNNVPGGTGLRFERNYNMKGTFDDDTLGHTANTFVAVSPSETLFARVRHFIAQARQAIRVQVVARVTTNCNLRIRLEWRHTDGTFKSEDLVNGAVLAATLRYSYYAEVISSELSDGQVSLYYTVNTDSAVYLQADITKL